MRGRYSRVTILFLTILLGFLISVQIKNLNNRDKYASIDDITEYKQIIEKEEAEIENIKFVIEDYKARINEFSDTKIKDGDISKLLEKEIKEYKTVSGFTDVYGPGVTIIIDDATRELVEGENPNWLLVHDADILNIINDLRVAGAEAISINGQRVLSSTEISCSGYTVEINGVDYGHPYIIRAIGEPRYLEAAINGPNTTGFWLKAFGIFVEVNTKTYIKIPKYDEDISFKYLITEK
ncbi:DUF881 domain-containing protein [Wukongibacter baidiensis]|uniref:DUF881 domain-containing protein n=1 Tax=Wukongibacter baidiensis TaxID=1723361 RepID=UPI003D7FB977